MSDSKARTKPDLDGVDLEPIASLNDQANNALRKAVERAKRYADLNRQYKAGTKGFDDVYHGQKAAPAEAIDYLVEYVELRDRIEARNAIGEPIFAPEGELTAESFVIDEGLLQHLTVRAAFTGESKDAFIRRAISQELLNPPVRRTV